MSFWKKVSPYVLNLYPCITNINNKRGCHPPAQPRPKIFNLMIENIDLKKVWTSLQARACVFLSKTLVDGNKIYGKWTLRRGRNYVSSFPPIYWTNCVNSKISLCKSGLSLVVRQISTASAVVNLLLYQRIQKKGTADFFLNSVVCFANLDE